MTLPNHSRVPPINRLPVAVLIAVRDEEANLDKCLSALTWAARVVVVDSHSSDRTVDIAQAWGAEVVQFDYRGGYPKKRQWAMDSIRFDTDWILLLDADELVPAPLQYEIAHVVANPRSADAYLITRGFHFLGRRFRFGGFSYAAVLLFRPGRAHFEELLDESSSGLDMEVHERLIVSGSIGRLHTPLVHEDFKGLAAYLDRHNRYSTWEAALRHRFLRTGLYGNDSIRPRVFGNTQERRRFLKQIAVRMPYEPLLWFLYHYIFRLGFLEGRCGYIASRIRSDYIAQVRAKMFELHIRSGQGP